MYRDFEQQQRLTTLQAWSVLSVEYLFGVLLYDIFVGYCNMLLTSSYIYMILSCTFRSCYVHRCASFNFLQILWRSNNSHYLESDSCKINNHFRFMIRDLVFEVNTCVAFSYYYITNKTFFRIKHIKISGRIVRNISPMQQKHINIFRFLTP